MHLVEQYSLVTGAKINKPFIETSYYPIPFDKYIVVENGGQEVKSRIYSMWTDIVADIKAWRSDSDTVGEVHAGFKGELDKIGPNISKWIEQFEDKKLVITGHSLGAAMATLFAARLNKRGGDVVLYTYGSPRAGNIEWSKQFENIAAYRFVNTNDIVCTVPPFGFYTHVGELHYMSYKGIILTKTSWWQRMGDKLRGRLRAWQKRQLFSGIYDHMGSRYIKKIKQQ